MRLLLVLIVAGFAGCGGSGDRPTAAEDMHTAADGLQETIDTEMDRARAVEGELQEAIDELDAAIDQASGEH